MASDTTSRVRQAIESHQIAQRKTGGNKTLRRRALAAFNQAINQLVETEGEAAVVAAFESAKTEAEGIRDSQTSLVA